MTGSNVNIKKAYCNIKNPLQSFDTGGIIIKNVHNKKSKDRCVKCRADGELPCERKAVACGIGSASRFISDLRFPKCCLGEEDFFMSEQNKPKGFKSVKGMVIGAMLCAMSVVIGKIPAVNLSDVLRIGFENFPVILAGYALGPISGALVGAVADLLGCLIKGYAINPIITVGAASVGAVSGLTFLIFKKKHGALPLFCAVAFSHIIGNMCIKTVGLYLWYEALRPTLIFRVPTYIITAAVEFALLYIILKNRQLRGILLGGENS